MVEKIKNVTWLKGSEAPGPPAMPEGKPREWTDVWMRTIQAHDWFSIPYVVRLLFQAQDVEDRQGCKFIWCEVVIVEPGDPDGAMTVGKDWCMLWMPRQNVFEIAKGDTATSYSIPSGCDEVDCALRWLKGELSPIGGVRIETVEEPA